MGAVSQNRPPLAVVMGVSGTGKTTIARSLAARLRLEYADADDFHPPANKAKMHAGIPLTDEDRHPWLEAIGRWLADHDGTGGVITCSALKRQYRDQLRHHAPRARFVHLAGDRELIAGRIHHRHGHFMPESLLGSQLATLEPLAPDEAGTVLDVAQSIEVLVAEAADYLEQA
jgi:gluconokinase